MQAKLQEEVDQAFEEAAGEFPSYTVVQGLPYLDMVVHETLRLHPPVPTTVRCCNHWQEDQLCIIINNPFHHQPPWQIPPGPARRTTPSPAPTSP